MSKIYLDTNILVSLLAEKSDDTRLAQRRSDSINALNYLNESGVTLCVSTWALTEMVKVLINDYGMPNKKVALLHNGITKTSSISGFEIKIISIKRYTIDQLFLDVREIMTIYSPGWGDAIHCVVMRKNKITQILSTDEKDDFKIIPGLELLHPHDINVTQTASIPSTVLSTAKI